MTAYALTVVSGFVFGMLLALAVVKFPRVRVAIHKGRRLDDAGTVRILALYVGDRVWTWRVGAPEGTRFGRAQW